MSSIRFPITFKVASQDITLERLISRSEARIRNLTHYFTGQPCSRGHVNLRYTSTTNCFDCKRQNSINNRTPHKMRKWRLSSRYGITTNDYDKLLRHQKGKCAICGESNESLVIDHNHDTNKVRGLLCHPCNRGLGQFKDNLGRLQAATKYLEEQDGRH